MEKMRWPPLKKVKIEEKDSLEEDKPLLEGDTDGDIQRRTEQERALVAIIENRIKEIHRIQEIIDFHNSELTYAKMRLEESQNQLALLRGQDVCKASESLASVRDNAGVDFKSANPEKCDSFGKHGSDLEDSECENLSPNSTQSKPQLVIPYRVSQDLKSKKHGTNSIRTFAVHPAATSLIQGNLSEQKMVKYPGVSSGKEVLENCPKANVTDLELKEHVDLAKLICKSSSPVAIHFQPSSLLLSQHKRRLRTLALCPSSEPLFVTSALDGVVNLWQVQGQGSSANLVHATDCSSKKHRRWPEDVVWHPRGDRLFSVYTADGGDSQVSIVSLNKKKTGFQKGQMHFLEDQPHTRGTINSIMFLPGNETCFVTGGSDHGVILWSGKGGEDSWKARTLHRDHHSSAVMGVAGVHHNNVVISAGADKRVIGFDVVSGELNCKYQLESKCMDVLPNPRDFNLLMVQTGIQKRQMRLFDLRLSTGEVESFGFIQESSESQSALIKQSWSPDGLYLTSGSADPLIHVFDIRYNARQPFQSIRVHQRRVFKASWHHSLPTLISISSDLNIGLHQLS